MIQVFAPGIPQPQGSKNAYRRGNKIVLVEANKNLPAWRRLVTEKLEAANSSCQPLTGAVSLDVMFFMPRGKTVKREMPTVPPDLDKLIRAINDSATDAGIIGDDSQVIEIVAYKFYEAENLPIGALITYSEFLGVSFDK
ncbi:MAG: RusA family crossover junction endodeoxyribonuclease [Bacteroidota bacterium]|jgi:Holliday junction resolvase RusA-like endonuclease